jgi:hypothetical protein
MVEFNKNLHKKLISKLCLDQKRRPLGKIEKLNVLVFLLFQLRYFDYKQTRASCLIITIYVPMII